MSRLTSIAVFLVSATATGGAHGDEVRRNPFEHPVFSEAPADSGTASGRAATETLLVSAILVAGNQSLVSVNGRIVGIGEEAMGYVLRSVAEEVAVFTRGEESVTISLFEQEADDDGR